MNDLKLSLDIEQVKAMLDVIHQETIKFTTDPHTAPKRINQLRLIEAVLSNHLNKHLKSLGI